MALTISSGNIITHLEPFEQNPFLISFQLFEDYSSSIMPAFTATFPEQQDLVIAVVYYFYILVYIDK